MGAALGLHVGGEAVEQQVLELATSARRATLPIVGAVTRRPWLLGLALALVTAGIVVALIASEPSGTGAENVGESGPERVVLPERHPAEEPARAERRSCKATQSNPGGTNNYIPDAPKLDSLGSGFVITGLVRSAAGCRPLKGVRIQVWLATETGGEQDNRASVSPAPTGATGSRRRRPSPQFGEPNIHVGYDDDGTARSSSAASSTSTTSAPSST